MELFSRSSYLSLPSKPGVYEFLAKDNSILYVGKAVDLKSRVSSYFSGVVTGEKTRLLVSRIAKIRITPVESELEALLLEAFYIKKFKPRFNIRLSDNKSYILVRITRQEKYPKVMLSRRIVNKKDIYFGPFPNSSAVKTVLKTVRRAFPYQSANNHPKRVCLYHHLGLCPCPTVFDSPELKKKYQKNIRGIIRIFEGEAKKIIRELEKERNALSAAEKFEEAGAVQKRIAALTYITQPFRHPREYAVNPNLRSDLRQAELMSLQMTLQSNDCMVSSLRKIECYDISNIQGKNATGSMVVFVDGEKEGSMYRKFKIRREAKPDDFASMKEVLKRRLKHTEWDYPGLIIVDGGKGQVSAAVATLQEANITIPLIGLAKREETIVIPLTLHPSPYIEISLPKDSKALHLIQRIRDEAHRFAVTYHRKLRSKSAIK